MTYKSLRHALPGVVLAFAISACFAECQAATAKPAVSPAIAPAVKVPQPVQQAQPAPAADVEFRTLLSDKSYRAALTRWLAEAAVHGKKWQLSWELPEDDYEFQYEGEFGADLLGAVDGLCAALNASGVHARAYFYEGSHVVRLVTEGTTR